MSQYLMTDEDVQGAIDLHKSVTPLAIVDWMETWRSVGPDSEQYKDRDRQLAIGEYALGIQI